MVNRIGAADYHPGLQRHHLLPRQLLSDRSFAKLFDVVGKQVGFDDFRRNGLLLPSSSGAARQLGLPMHRGPHRRYNALVIERVGQIEMGWSSARLREPYSAREQALMRLALLQRALRRRLLDPVRTRLALNRNDPLGRSIDFSDLDAMAEALWSATQPDQTRIWRGEGHQAWASSDQPEIAFAALSTARTLAVATSSSMPTPQMV